MKIMIYFILGVFLLACENELKLKPEIKKASAEYQKSLITQLIKAQKGDIIKIPEGKFYLTRALSLKVDGVTIKGQGMDKSILSFKQQQQGAEGLIVNADNVLIEDLAIEDTKGDGIKVNEGDYITIRNTRVEWTNGPDEDNGSYGLYPVQCNYVLIEGTIVKGASDAGIYVGQSKNIIVKNNLAEFNVAGIEIENSIGADVYNNTVRDNTGGILVFNMPDLPQPGHSTRVFNNQIMHNNTDNFAPKGTAVASVPAGSGVVINSNDKVEIFANKFIDNETAHIIIASYFSAGFEREMVTDFDPYPETIFIYDNEYKGGGNSPGHLDLKALKLAEFGLNGRLPNILWDGILNPKTAHAGKLSSAHAICIDEENAEIINVDAGNNFQNISIDIEPHLCKHPKLGMVKPWSS